MTSVCRSSNLQALLDCQDLPSQIQPLLSAYETVKNEDHRGTRCQGCWACLLFSVQRSSVGGEGRVVVLDELLEEVLDEV